MKLFSLVLVTLILILTLWSEVESKQKLSQNSTTRIKSRNRSWWHEEFRNQMTKELSKIQDTISQLSKNVAKSIKSNSRMNQEFVKVQTSLFYMMNGHKLLQKLEECAQNLSLGNDLEAKKIWDSLETRILPQDKLDYYTSKIFDKIQLNSTTQLKPLLSFAKHIKSAVGFDKILNQLFVNELVYGKSEIFIVAHALRQTCGKISRKNLKSFPAVVEHVAFNVVRIQNAKSLEFIRRPFDSSLRVAKEVDLAGLWTLDIMEEDGRFVLQSELFYTVIQPPPTLHLNFELVDNKTFRIRVIKNEQDPQSVGKYLASLSDDGRNHANVSNSAGNLLGFLPKDHHNFNATLWTAQINNSTVLNSSAVKSKWKLC